MASVPDLGTTTAPPHESTSPDSQDTLAPVPDLGTKTVPTHESTSVVLHQKSALDKAPLVSDASPTPRFQFTKLPNETKREVYLLLLANHDIYLTVRDVRPRSGDGRVTKGPLVRKAMETSFKGLSPRSSFPIEFSGARPPKHTHFSLSILRVSHEMYDEARLIPYTHNTFYMDTNTLEYFIDGRAPYQKQSLRSLSLKLGFFEHHRSFNFVSLMLKASCSLSGLKKLRVLTDFSRVDDDYDLTIWMDGLKIWGIRRLELSAKLVVDMQVPNGSVLSDRRGLKLLQMTKIARTVSKELSDRGMVEDHRKLATKVFNKLPEYFRKSMMDTFVKLRSESNGGWLPGSPETMA